MKASFEALGEEHRTAVIDIFNYYAENSFAAYPETKMPGTLFDMFLDIAKKYPAYAIRREDGAVVGFCLLRPYNPFPVFRETAEISYFIGKDAAGQGVGSEALRRLEDDAKKLGIKNILASIVSRNEQSLQFHRKHGFQECGRFTDIGRKFGEVFDIVWMQKVI